MEVRLNLSKLSNGKSWKHEIPDRRKQNLLSNFIHENVHLKSKRLFVQRPAVDADGDVKRRRNGRQEFRAREIIRRFEFGHVALRHFVHLFCVVLLLQHRVKGLVDALRVQDQTDGQQGVHLIGLFVDLVILVCLRLKMKKTVNYTWKIQHENECCYNMFSGFHSIGFV